ncbi:MAG: metallophosphoesterase [Verrucomicrobia bacterium]|nr:metallophosphoesterase [Verrucomicrobiota bacterium]
MNTSVTRREFVQRSSVVAASLAGLPWVGRAAETVAPIRRALDLAFVRPPLATFAVVTDTHFGLPADGQGEHIYTKLAKQTLAEMQTSGVDFIIHLGDILNHFPTDPQWPVAVKLAREQFAASRAPIYAVPGNHDVGNKPSLTSPTVAVNRVRQEWLDLFRQQFKSDYHVIDRAGCRVILLNCLLFNTGLPAERAQWDRLRGDLEAAKGSKIVLGFHMPLFWCRQDDPGPGNYHLIDEPVRGQLLELVRQYKVRAVFTGHAHQPIVNAWSEALLLTAPSTSFACSYGFYPGLKSLHTEPSKLGWLLVRVYEDDLIINRFRPRTAEQPAGASLLLARQSAENARCHLATMLAAPRAVVARWAPELVADGNRLSSSRPAAEVERSGWSSAYAAKPECQEWIRLTFAEPVNADRVVLWPRFDGKGTTVNFPTDFVVQATEDGKTWTTLKQFSGFRPEANAALTVNFASQKAVAIAVVASRLPGNGGKPAKYAFQLVEFEAFNGEQQLRVVAVHASSSAGDSAPTRLDSPLLETADLGVRYVRVVGAINTEDFMRAMAASRRLGQRPVMSLPPESRIVSDAIRTVGRLAALVETPNAEIFNAAVRAGAKESQLMLGPVTPDKIADAVAAGPIWVSVALDGQGKTGRELARQIETIRAQHPRTVFWFDIVNPPAAPTQVAQLFLLTYGLGVIVNILPAATADSGALLDHNCDPTPAFRALQALATAMSEPMRRTIDSHEPIHWLRFEASPRFVEALWTDGNPVRVSLGAQRAGATVVDLATGVTRPLPVDNKVNVGNLPTLVCKR